MSRLVAVSLATLAALASAPAPAQSSAQSPGQSNAQQDAQEAPAADPQIAEAARVLQSSIDAWRAGDFEGWIARYSPSVVVQAPQMFLENREELRAVYRPVFDAGIPAPTILDSGWTGERIYVRQREYVAEGVEAGVTYAEYDVKGGLITAVYASVE